MKLPDGITHPAFKLLTNHRSGFAFNPFFRFAQYGNQCFTTCARASKRGGSFHFRQHRTFRKMTFFDKAFSIT